VSTLHEITGRLPTHQRVLPTVTFLQNVPVHSPVMAVPGTGLRCRLRRLVNPSSMVRKRRVTEVNLNLYLTVRA
jgi:hypothetical protein